MKVQVDAKLLKDNLAALGKLSSTAKDEAQSQWRDVVGLVAHPDTGFTLIGGQGNGVVLVTLEAEILEPGVVHTTNDLLTMAKLAGKGQTVTLSSVNGGALTISSGKLKSKLGTLPYQFPFDSIASIFQMPVQATLTLLAEDMENLVKASLAFPTPTKFCYIELNQREGSTQRGEGGYVEAMELEGTVEGEANIVRLNTSLLKPILSFCEEYIRIRVVNDGRAVLLDDPSNPGWRGFMTTLQV